MSSIIPFPCLEQVDILHLNKFKFLTKEDGWVCFDYNRQQLKNLLPEYLYNMMSDRTSIHDFMNRENSRLSELLGSKNSEDYQEWLDTSLIKSKSNAEAAQIISEERELILQQIKKDFFHPKVEISQGYRSKDDSKIQIGGTLASYRKETLNSLFYSFGHFVMMSQEDVETKNYNHCINQNNTNPESIACELKIIALAETLSNYYKVPMDSHDFFFQAISDYEGSEEFYKQYLHLVKVFESYNKEDEESIAFNEYFLIEKEGVNPREAKEIAKKRQQEILHNKHKRQVIQSYYEQKVKNKYSFEHVKFMFDQQLPFIK